ncbi:MAG: hypothetical protein JRN15_12585 [Nitrososphaerota archaeon]|nr:hypothetical protein [Nitrososphaerota archaeon]
MPQQSRRAGLVPDVIVDFECEEGMLYVSIQNTGSLPAYKISVEFDKKIRGIENEKEISSLNLFKSIEFLPPGKKIRAFIDSFPSYVIRKQPMMVQTTITYSGKNRRKFVESIKHNLLIYKDLPDIM